MCKNVIKFEENGVVVEYCYGSKFETSSVKMLEGDDNAETPIIDKVVSVLYTLEELEFDFSSVKKVAPLLVKAYGVMYIAKTTGEISVKKYRKAREFLEKIKVLINISKEAMLIDICECNETATEAINEFRKNKNLENYRLVKVYF